MVNNLIIATTPLQAKIAKYIQREYADDTFISLYLTPVMNERHRYYSEGFTEVYCIQTVEDYEEVIEKYIGEYKTIFYASFDHPVILDIVASSSYQHLMSFDDGYADIYPYGMYALPLTNQQIGKLGVTRDDLIRKKTFHIEGVQYLNSPYIVEDVLAELWKKYEFIEIYHFTSSVSLHLQGVKNITVKGISIPYYEKRQNELRRLGCDFETVTIGW